MFLASLILGFISTLFLCRGIILLKWIITQVGVNLFVLLMFLLTAIFLLAMGEKDYDEDEV